MFQHPFTVPAVSRNIEKEHVRIISSPLSTLYFKNNFKTKNENNTDEKCGINIKQLNARKV
jgi:hypothetical protein